LNTFSKLAPASLWSCTARSTKLPKAIHDQEITYLFFGNDNKLWRITAISSSFENDPYGNGAKSRYDELVGILSEKKIRQGDQCAPIRGRLFKRPDNFVYGIQQGQTAWFTNFANPDLFIQLGLLAEGQSTLRWRVIYENKVLKKAFDQDQKSREKGSL